MVHPAASAEQALKGDRHWAYVAPESDDYPTSAAKQMGHH